MLPNATVEQRIATGFHRNHMLNEEGGIIARKWMKLWPSDKPLPAFDWVIMSLDTAFTEKTLNKRTYDADSSACTVWGVFSHRGLRQAMLLDAWDEHLGYPELRAKVEALQSGQLGGAGLDVTEVEPLPIDSPLWDMPQVLVTPHVGAQSLRRADVTTKFLAANLSRYVQGRTLRNVVDKSLGYPRPEERDVAE